VSEKAQRRARQQAKAAVPPVRSGGSRRRSRRPLWQALTVAVVLGAVLGFATHHGSASGTAALKHLPLGSLADLGPLATPAPAGPTGPEGEPIPRARALAAAGSLRPGQTVDGIQCQTSEQLVYHIHVHLTVFVDGQPRQIPYGIGIGPPVQVHGTPTGPFASSGTCFSWLHTHAADGIVHIESPTQRIYTLGDFFDVWGKTLTSREVAGARGRVVAFIDGRPYEGNPRDVPLFAHAQIQLDVGRPLVRPESVRFANGL